MARKSVVVGSESRGDAADTAIKTTMVRAIGFEVEGLTPLLQNSFSQKAAEQMLRKHMGISVTREVKRPSEVIAAATILNMEGVVCEPPVAFKLAMISAAGQVKTLKKNQLRTQLYVEGGSVPIVFAKMEPQMDIVRTSGMNRTPDVRFRPRFEGWSARLIIDFADTLNPATVTDLLARAGGVGVGEWRPEHNGTFGTFKVVRVIDTAKELVEVRAISRPIVKPLTIPDWALEQEVDMELIRKIMGNHAVDQEDVEA